MNEHVDIDALAQEIRRVDGSHRLGAGQLAEALAPYLSALTAAPREPYGHHFRDMEGRQHFHTGANPPSFAQTHIVPLFAAAPLPREGGEYVYRDKTGAAADQRSHYPFPAEWLDRWELVPAPVAAGEWVTVPRVPTAKMLSHAWDECALGGKEDYRDFWRAMLSAAPSPPVAGECPESETFAARYRYALALIEAAADDPDGMSGVAYSAQVPLDLIEGKSEAEIAAFLCENAHPSLAAPAPVAEDCPTCEGEFPDTCSACSYTDEAATPPAAPPVGEWPTSEPRYSVLFNAIAAATKPEGGGAIGVSVAAFLESLKGAAPSPQQSGEAVAVLRNFFDAFMADTARQGAARGEGVTNVAN